MGRKGKERKKKISNEFNHAVHLLHTTLKPAKSFLPYFPCLLLLLLLHLSLSLSISLCFRVDTLPPKGRREVVYVFKKKAQTQAKQTEEKEKKKKVSRLSVRGCQHQGQTHSALKVCIVPSLTHSLTFVSLAQSSGPRICTAIRTRRTGKREEERDRVTAQL